MRRAPLALLFLLLTTLSCDRSERLPTEPDSAAPTPSFSQATLTQSEHFFFLPPLADDPTPTGEFDPSFLPYLTVSICELSGDVCTGDPIAEYTSEGKKQERLRIDHEDEHYIVNWKTKKGYKGNTYRITVLVGAVELGYADRHVDRKDAGSNAPVRFRIEAGIAGTGTIGPSGGVVIDLPTGAAIIVPSGAVTSQVTIALREEGIADPEYEPLSQPLALSIDTEGEDPGWSEFETIRVVLPLTRRAQNGSLPLVRAYVDAFPFEDFWAEVSSSTEAVINLDIPADGFGNLFNVIEGFLGSPATAATVYLDAEEFWPNGTTPQPLNGMTNVESMTPSLAQVTATATLDCDDPQAVNPILHYSNSPPPAPGSTALLLIHGFRPKIGNCADYESQQETALVYFEKLLPVLRAEFPDVPILTFTYRTFVDFRDGPYPTTDALLNELRSLVTQTGIEGFVIVAHSMGGLVSTHAIAKEQTVPASPLITPLVKGIITLGTPYRGTISARPEWLMEVFGVAKPSEGSRSLHPGVPLPNPVPVPVIQYYGGLGGFPGRTDDVTSRERLSASAVSFACNCNNDGLIEVASASAADAIGKVRPYTGRDGKPYYTHWELHEGYQHTADRTTDVLYQELFSDIRALMIGAPPGPYGLTYWLSRSPNFEIRRISPDGSDELLFRSTAGGSRELEVSPDGSRIAFAQSELASGLPPVIRTVRSDGTGLQTVTFGSLVSWSPDGTELVYSRTDVALQSSIYRVPRGGGAPTPVLDTSYCDLWPAWSPDGSTIAFSRGDPDCSGNYSVRLTDPDGSSVSSPVPTAGSAAYNVDYSPDGQWMAYYIRPNAVDADIVVSRVDGSQQKRLLPSSWFGNTGCSGGGLDPKWSPDGSRIAFIGSEPCSGYDIFTIKPDGSDLVKVTSINSGNILPVDWLIF